MSAEKVREMALGNVVVGSWETLSEGSEFETFVPLAIQPPAETANDVRSVEAWLKERGIPGDYAVIREYTKFFRISKIEKVVSETHSV